MASQCDASRVVFRVESVRSVRVSVKSHTVSRQSEESERSEDPPAAPPPFRRNVEV